MLEDFAMEKKPSGRQSQAPVKGNATESKKNQDAVGNKILPRTSRRREPVNSAGPKYEQNRKPAPQKGKSIDKRPRPRGQYYSSGKEDTKVAEEDEVEYGSVLMPGSKKQNLNHLLNFHYAPRDGVTASSRSWRSNLGSHGRNYSSKWLMTTHKHKYNKEQFLQANCQFVVKSDGDYSAYMTNPDMLVDWDMIEQIQLRSAEILSCPICLYPPVAAKMTRCGHVFCWSCILHYLALSDKPWRKCPICYESVHKKDLRSVVAVPHTHFSVGEEITLRLMKRKRGSLIAMPVEQCGIQSPEKLLSVSETTLDTKYSKLLLASSAEVASIIGREKWELEVQLAEEKSCPEACFIEQALELLKQRKVSFDNGIADIMEENKSLNNILPTACESADESEKKSMPVCEPWSNEYGQTDLCTGMSSFSEEEDNFDENGLKNIESDTSNRQRFESVSSEGLGSEDGGAITVEDLETPSMQPSVQEGTPVKDFYFYQAADGQHTYLHAINVRMLEQSYGSLQNSPLTLTGCIVEKESGSMTEELRQRLRYLQHLPVSCPFEVAEIVLRPPVVNKETIDFFQDQLETRRRRRQRRARDEKAREKRINEEEKKLWGRFPTPHISINSHRQFPFCGVETENAGSNVSASATSSLGSSPTHLSDDFLPLASAVKNLEVGQNKSEDSGTENSKENVNSSSGPSFAQMLRDGKGRNISEWPSGKSGKNACSPNLGKHRPLYAYDSDAEQEGSGSSRSVAQSFGDAITQALERAAACKDDTQDNAGNSGKKKKKQKQKVLFATGMACIGK